MWKTFMRLGGPVDAADNPTYHPDYARRPPPAPHRRSPHGPDAGLHDPERSAAHPRAVDEPQLARRPAEAMVHRTRDGRPGDLAEPRQGRGLTGRAHAARRPLRMRATPS